MPNIILISGGFDPIHSGHIKLINDASKYGDVIVLLNSDEWLRNKKGKEFLSFDERKIIMQNIKGVINVIEFEDSDKTCIDGIKKAKSVYKNNLIKFPSQFHTPSSIIENALSKTIRISNLNNNK